MSPRRKTETSAEFSARLRKEYERGDSLRDLKARHGLSTTAIQRRIEAAGGVLRARGYMSPKQERELRVRQARKLQAEAKRLLAGKPTT